MRSITSLAFMSINSNMFASSIFLSDIALLFSTNIMNAWNSVMDLGLAEEPTNVVRDAHEGKDDGILGKRALRLGLV